MMARVSYEQARTAIGAVVMGETMPNACLASGLSIGQLEIVLDCAIEETGLFGARLLNAVVAIHDHRERHEREYRVEQARAEPPEKPKVYRPRRWRPVPGAYRAIKSTERPFHPNIMGDPAPGRSALAQRGAAQ